MTNEITITDNNEITILDATTNLDVTSAASGSFIVSSFASTRTLQTITDTWNAWTRRIQAVDRWDIRHDRHPGRVRQVR
jgi:hypothetical protein